jgi:AcrR family transcriptional regulator
MVIAGQGDPARTMRRLWGVAGDGGPAPGPKAAYDTAHVVATALDLARGRRTDPISLRALAAALGITAMAVYTYVGSKEELLDLMYDRVHAAFVPPPAAVPADGATAWAENLLAVYVDHPWATGVSYARPVLGPHEQAVLESLLVVLEPGRFAADDRRALVTALFSLVRSTAATIADTRATAADDARWWAARSRALLEVVPDFTERYPRSTALGGAGSSLEQRARDALRRAVVLLVEGARR